MNKLSILVIDDEKELELIYKAHLGKIDAEVTFSDHPQKAWKNIDKSTFDLIITDLKMPIISGDEFINIVRTSRTNSNTPIILCSGYIDKKVSSELTRASKVYLLAKPFTQKSLTVLIEKIFYVAQSEIENKNTSEFDNSWVKKFEIEINNLKIISSTNSTDSIDDVWNFECINLDFIIQTDNIISNCSLNMHTSTFLKVAGKAQGTLYKEVETEVLLIWKKILKDTGINPGHIVFSESRSKKIIHFPNELFTKKLLSTDCGNILIYIK